MQAPLLFQRYSAALHLDPHAVARGEQLLTKSSTTQDSNAAPALDSARAAAACFLSAPAPDGGGGVSVTDVAMGTGVRAMDVVAAARVLLSCCQGAPLVDASRWVECLARVERKLSTSHTAFESYNRLFHTLIGAASQEEEERLWLLWEHGWLLVCAEQSADIPLQGLVLAGVNCILGDLPTAARQRSVDLITRTALAEPSPGTEQVSGFDANLLSELDTFEMLVDTEGLPSEPLLAVHQRVSRAYLASKQHPDPLGSLHQALDATLGAGAEVVDPRFMLNQAKDKRAVSTPLQPVQPSPLPQPSPLKLVRRSLRRSVSSGGLRWLFEPSGAQNAAERSWLEAMVAREEPEGPHEEVVRELGEEARRVLEAVVLAGDEEENQRLRELVRVLFARSLRREAAKSRCTIEGGAVLRNREFSQCLLALSCQVVIHVYRVADAGFPWVLRTFSVGAFQFSKAVDTFVRLLEPEGCELGEACSLSELRRCFVSIDCEICERLGWARDSPVHALLAHAHRKLHNGLHARIDSEKLLHEDSCTSAELFGAAQEGSCMRSEVPISHSRVLDLFLRKVLHFAARRVHELCCFIGKTLPPHTMSEAGLLGTEQRVWRVVTSVVGGPHASAVLADRHTDTVILCAIYGVFRVAHRDLLSFNEVVDVYKRTKGASHDSRVYRQVAISNGDKRVGDICEYYNADFVPLMGESLKLSMQERHEKITSPPMCPQPMLHTLNSSWSPKTAEPVKSIALYHIGESSGSALEETNRVLCENRRRKASQLDEVVLGVHDMAPQQELPHASKAPRV